MFCTFSEHLKKIVICDIVLLKVMTIFPCGNISTVESNCWPSEMVIVRESPQNENCHAPAGYMLIEKEFIFGESTVL